MKKPKHFSAVLLAAATANWRTMERRLEALEAQGIPSEFHAYEGPGHGFGLGLSSLWLF